MNRSISEDDAKTPRREGGKKRGNHGWTRMDTNKISGGTASVLPGIGSGKARDQATDFAFARPWWGFHRRELNLEIWEKVLAGSRNS